MAEINQDLIFDSQTFNFEATYDLEIGKIINMTEPKLCMEKLEVAPTDVKKIAKPTKTRSPVYQFFEWDNDTNKWKCLTCK